jgi:hypothetical protein
MYIIKYFINYSSDGRSVGIDRSRTQTMEFKVFYKLSMWLLPVNEMMRMFVARQHLNSGANLRECKDQISFKVQAVPVFRFD